MGKQITNPNETINILQNINLSVYNKETVAIVGSSGSGKTTLLHIMGGLDTPTFGHIYFHGEDISRFSPLGLAYLRNQKIGFIFQFHHLLPEFSTLENVAMPALIQGQGKKRSLEKAKGLLRTVGLSGQEKQPVLTLSGGERQLASTARALMQDPDCLFADEPTGNLDEKNGEIIQDLLLHLNQKLGTTLILATHNHDLADKMQKKLLLKSGELSEMETAEKSGIA